MQGHIECENVCRSSYIFSVFIYEQFEDYLCYIVENGIYSFSNPIPREWKDCRLYRILGEASVRRIMSSIDSQNAYA